MRFSSLGSSTGSSRFPSRLVGVLSAAGCALGLSLPACAAPITGQLSIAGYVDPVGSSGFGSATGLDFLKNATSAASLGVAGGLSSYGTGSGSFAGYGCFNAGGDCGTIQDIASFASTAALPSFVTLTTGTYSRMISFDLTSITSITRSSDSTGGSLTLAGLGTIHDTGYDNTAGSVVLTVQGNGTSIFSGVLQATPVAATPEPSSLVLLMTGVGGVLAGVRRRVL